MEKCCGTCQLFQGFDGDNRYYGKCLWLNKAVVPYWVPSYETHAVYGRDCQVYEPQCSPPAVGEKR